MTLPRAALKLHAGTTRDDQRPPLLARSANYRGLARLWSVQQALSTLTLLGLVDNRTAGGGTVHSTDEEHTAVRPQRSLLDPAATLTSIVADHRGRIQGNPVDDSANPLQTRFRAYGMSKTYAYC